MADFISVYSYEVLSTALVWPRLGCFYVFWRTDLFIELSRFETRLPTQTTLRFSPGTAVTMLAFFVYRCVIGI